MKNQLFITGAVRSGTNWIFNLLSANFKICHSEFFDYQEILKRKKEFLETNSLLFKMNEDMRDLLSLENAFPEAKILIVLRHPLEVVHSIFNPNRKSIPYRPFFDLKKKWSFDSDVDLLPAAVRRFESYFSDETLNKIIKFESNLLVIRYEDLLDKFDSTLENISKFCEFKKSIINKQKLLPRNTPNQGIFISHFSSIHQDIIQSSRIPYICEKLRYSLD